jgi:purine nucleosidase
VELPGLADDGGPVVSRAITDLVLDTDIGSDVDDVLALATIFGSPELRLQGVTTVYGDVQLRARMVARVASVAGQDAGPIVPGRSETRSGRPVWWPGHEGRLLADLDTEAIDKSTDPIDLLAAAPVIAAVGPLTNVAEAVERPGRASLVVMGGEFTDGVVEHNIRCDIAAADAVFRSGRPATVIGLDQTERMRLDQAVVGRLEASGVLGALLAAEIRQFWAFVGRESNAPHDPAAVLMLTNPQLFRFRTGHIEVETAGPRAGRTHFREDPSGPHRIVADLDPLAVGGQITDRVLAACAPRPVALLEGGKP